VQKEERTKMLKSRCLLAALVLTFALPAPGAGPAPLATGQAVGSFTVKGKTWTVSHAVAVSRPSEVDPKQADIKVILTAAPVPAGSVDWLAGDAPAVLAYVVPRDLGFNILYEGGGTVASNQEYVVELTENDGKVVAGRVRTAKEILQSRFDIRFRAAVVKVK
jgi:hypothetical protein